MTLYYSAITNGFYDSEIHSVLPDDAVEITIEEHSALLDGQSVGKLISSDINGLPILTDPPAPSLDQIKSQLTIAIQNRLDVFAQTRGYDGILSAATYNVSANSQFSAEGQYAVTARDETWLAAYSILADVEAGVRSVPTKEELMLELPVLNWPV